MEPAIADLIVDWTNGALTAADLHTSLKTMGELRSIFADRHAANQMPADIEIYRIQAYTPVPAGTEGGLFWGRTILQPGNVGEEFFMTKGHFHRIRNRAEYYFTFQGTGALLLMDEARTTRHQDMFPGSVHYIPGSTAHRVANTGSTPLVFSACWPSDAGYDYETIDREGFSARMLLRGGKPVLVPGK
ncbi:MAG: glucose-6-phosphate isomerase family protein [Acidobacteriaceae bacterium]